MQRQVIGYLKENNVIVRFNFCQGHSADLQGAFFQCLRNAIISIKIEIRNQPENEREREL